MMKGMKKLQKESKKNKKAKKSGIANIFNRLRKIFSELSTSKKVQAIIASVVTLILLIAIPIYAWFTLGKNIEAFTKIKEPDNLDIRAGHYDAVQYFSLNDIDIENVASGNPHRVVFSVSAGDYKIPYQIQLAHTTNIPFKYKIYRAREFINAPSSGTYVTYISEPLKAQAQEEQEEINYTFYYSMLDEVALSPKNPDPNSINNYGRQLALGSDAYYNDTYKGGDAPEIYAIPLYEQSGKIPYDSASEHDYFILEISFDETAIAKEGFSDWNEATNKKETDMVYLTASRWSN